MVLCSKTRSQEHISPLFIQPITESYSLWILKEFINIKAGEKEYWLFFVFECMDFKKQIPHNTINFLYVFNTAVI